MSDTDVLANLTISDFSQHVGERLRIELDEARSVEVELTEARELLSGTEKRTPFSIVLRGPEDLALEQRIYSVHGEAFGKLDLFLVTVGPDKQGMLYEAVFT